MNERQRLVVTEVGDVTVVQLLDRKVIRAERIEQLGEELFALVEREKRNKLLLDFSEIEFLSSAALNKIIQLERRVRNRGGRIKLCGLHPEISQVFNITKLDQMFDIRPDREAALTAF